MNIASPSRKSPALPFAICARVLGVVLLLGCSFANGFAESSFTGLGFLPDGGRSIAVAVSSDGSTVVGQADQGLNSIAFRWTAASGMIALGSFPGGYTSNARSVSGDGSVVWGEGMSPSGCKRFQWTAAHGMVALDPKTDANRLPIPRLKLNKDFPFKDPTIGAVSSSSDGKIIVGNRLLPAFCCESFRWTKMDGFMYLGYLPGCDICCASAISNDGSVVVGYGSRGPAEQPSMQKAFIWDKVNGIRDFQSLLTSEYHIALTGWELQKATDISADGRTIVGTGKHNGHYEAWVAHLDRPVNAPAGKERSR
ncbi:MAG: hypothetical protein NT105_16105 [Verrucomicrobia bacterium]|nr:hypothetical protein [Verrucomicrobiota bacterium]